MPVLDFLWTLDTKAPPHVGSGGLHSGTPYAHITDTWFVALATHSWRSVVLLFEVTVTCKHCEYTYLCLFQAFYASSRLGICYAGHVERYWYFNLSQTFLLYYIPQVFPVHQSPKFVAANTPTQLVRVGSLSESTVPRSSIFSVSFFYKAMPACSCSTVSL